MSRIAFSLLVILIVLLLAIVFFAIRNRFLIRLSLRNIPRRRAQTVLIIVGLMLSTTIVAASLAIGDTIAVSIRNAVLDSLGETDIVISKPNLGPFGNNIISAEEIEEVARFASGDARIDGMTVLSDETLPVLNTRTNLTQARTIVRGINIDGLNGISWPQSEESADTRANLASLSDDEVIATDLLADEIDAQPGDTITVVTPIGRSDLRIRDIEDGSDQSISMPAATYHRVVGTDPSTADAIWLSIDLDSYDLEETSDSILTALQSEFTDPDVAARLHAGIKSLDGAVEGLERYIEDNTGNTNAADNLDADVEADLRELVRELKQDEPSERFRILAVDNNVIQNLISALVSTENQALLQNLPSVTVALGQLERLSTTDLKVLLLGVAETVGSIFTTFFTFFGSFSVIVGLLLIFLIFVLLASERQHEMGIARAVGTKRAHLVQMFTFEGLAYAVGSALIGTAIGIGAGRVLVGMMARAFGTDDDPTFSIDFSVTIYSIIAAFSVGLILTLLTVIFSAYRVSKLNIVVAIRNLPEEFVASDTPPLLRRLLNFVFWIFGPFYMIVQLVVAIRHHGDVRVASAIRNLSEKFVASDTPSLLKRLLNFVFWIFSPVYLLVQLVRSIRRHGDVRVALLRLVFTLLIVGWVIGLVASFARIFMPYFAQGWPVAILGAALAAYGLFSADSAWQAYIGASLTIYGLGMFARTLMIGSGLRETISSRVTYTIVGLLILVIWAVPERWSQRVTGELDGNIEMFVLAGIWMVASAVWVVMYNSDLLVQGLESTMGRIKALKPILKPAVAYAVANRFRTGLTVAMFALVIFVMMSFSVLNSSFNTLVTTPELVTGGFDIRAEVSVELPIDDISSAVDASSNLNSSDFTFIASLSDQSGKARQTDGEEVRYLDLVVRGAEADYFRNTLHRVQFVDTEYLPQNIDLQDDVAVAKAVWEAVANDPSLAVITNEHVPGLEQQFGGGIGPEILQLEDVEPLDGQMTAKEVNIALASATDLSRTAKRTVIAVIDDNADSLEGGGGGQPATGFTGIYTQIDIFDELSDEDVPLTIFRMKLADGVDAGRTAAAMETAFLDNSMLAIDVQDEVETSTEQNRQFGLLFQGFMGLGLIVGVASLGVLSLRAVNERRMQIAIMRAIGYRARMIRIQFMMESVFITVVGTGLGLALGTLVAWSFLSDIDSGLEFTIPWVLVISVIVIAVTAALITTYVPANQASKVYPAEALRYE